MSYVAQNTPEECAEYCGAEGYTGFFMNHEYPNTMCKCSTDGCVTRYSSNYHADAYEIQVTNGESKPLRHMLSLRIERVIGLIITRIMV